MKQFLKVWLLLVMGMGVVLVAIAPACVLEYYLPAWAWIPIELAWACGVGAFALCYGMERTVNWLDKE